MTAEIPSEIPSKLLPFKLTEGDKELIRALRATHMDRTGNIYRDVNNLVVADMIEAVAGPQ